MKQKYETREIKQMSFNICSHLAERAAAPPGVLLCMCWRQWVSDRGDMNRTVPRVTVTASNGDEQLQNHLKQQSEHFPQQKT